VAPTKTPGRPVATFRAADRRFARSVLVGLFLVGAVAVLGPLLNFRADVAVIRDQLQARVAREADVYVQGLRVHFELLRADLERLAKRPEIDLFDDSTAPEQAVLDLTHHGSVLFRVGVAVLGVDGSPVWTEPEGMLANERGLRSQRWFQDLLARGTPVFDAVRGRPGIFVVGVPIERAGDVTGVLAGFSDAASGLLPERREGDPDLDLLIFDADGNPVVPTEPPPWVRQLDRPRFLRELLALPDGGPAVLGGREHLAAAVPIGTTGFTLVVAADSQRVIAPTRGRLLVQLAFIGVLQLATIVFFFVFFRRIYRAYLQVEARAAEQEKMAALGTAASLIAHEVKNSLNGLKAATALNGTGDGRLARSVDAQLDRLAHLATSLLQFGKPATAQRVETRLDELARESIERLRVLPEFDEVEVTTALETPIAVRCDPLLVVTALDNLVRNAIEAAVTAKDLGRVAAPAVHLSAGRDDGHAFVAIEDNAGGPPSEVEMHLFEPFTTSKPKGIGLGLCMAKRAIDEEGGTLVFERTAAGSRFTVRLRVDGTET
jgi:signal transduction histidine kinase